MTRLIVTTDSSTAGGIQRAGLADLVIAIEHRLVWGPLPSDAELEAFFAPRTTQPHGLHWLDDTPSWRLEESGMTGRGLIELMAECESVELWPGPEPNAQLILLWLLDRCGGERAAVCKLAIRHLDNAVRLTNACVSLSVLPYCASILRGDLVSYDPGDERRSSRRARPL